MYNQKAIDSNRTMKLGQDVVSVRIRAIKRASKLLKAGVAANWSEAMKLGWVYAKAQHQVRNGQPVAFTKKSTGELRVVNNPALYSSSKPKTGKSSRPAKPYLLVFKDLDKDGYNVISCDIRTILV